MITILSRSPKENILKKVSEYHTNAWVYVTDPSEDELKTVSGDLGLDIGHLTDALDPFEVPRFEVEDEAIYVFTRVPIEENGAFSTVPVVFVFVNKKLVTLSKRAIPLFEKYVDGIVSVKKSDPLRFFIQLFGEIVDSYHILATKINKRISAVSTNVDMIKNRDIILFVGYEHILNELLNAIIQTNLIMKNLMSSKRLLTKQEDRELVEDLFLETGQLIEFYKSSLHNVKNMRDAYSTILTNNLNRIIKFFTALTIVLTIPTIIASFYGMNVPLPLSGHPFAFVFILTETIVVCLILLFVFMKKNWL